MIISNGQTIIQHLLSLVRHIYRRIYLKTRLLIHQVSSYYTNDKSFSDFQWIHSHLVYSYINVMLAKPLLIVQFMMLKEFYKMKKVLQTPDIISGYRYHFRYQYLNSSIDNGYKF